MKQILTLNFFLEFDFFFFTICATICIDDVFNNNFGHQAFWVKVKSLVGREYQAIWRNILQYVSTGTEESM